MLKDKDKYIDELNENFLRYEKKVKDMVSKYAVKAESKSSADLSETAKTQ